MKKNSILRKIVFITVCIAFLLSLPLVALAGEVDTSVSDTAGGVSIPVMQKEEPADATGLVAEEPIGDLPAEAPEDEPVPAAAEPAAEETLQPETVQAEKEIDEPVITETTGAEEVPAVVTEPLERPVVTGRVLNAAAPVVKAASPSRITYSGEKIGFFKEDGVSEFGMLSLQEGSAYVLDGNTVRIYDVPSNPNVYDGLHWGFTTDDPLTKDVHSLSNGYWKLELSAENCGYGIAVAPVKKDDRGGGTTSSQYYLCLPAKSSIPVSADYSGVDTAIASVPGDLSIYTAASVKAVEDAIEVTEDILFRYKTKDKQSEVDKAAADINSAVAALVKKDGIVTEYKISFKAVDSDTGKVISGAAFTVKDSKGNSVKPDVSGVYTLPDGSYSVKASANDYEDGELGKFVPTKDETVAIKLKAKEVIPPGTTVFREDEKDPSKTNLFNTTGMFKVVKGVLVSKGNASTLTVTMSGTGYHYLFKGTYEECLAGGFDKSKWIAGKVNADGKWEFVIPVGQTETFIPIVAVSDSHLKKVEKGEEELGDAIFARQLVIDPKAVTLTSGDYDAVVDVKVISKADEFKADPKGTMEVVGGPNSNNYACKPAITMLDGRFDKAFIGTAADAAKSSEIIKISGGKFTIPLVNSFGDSGKVIMFEDKKPVAMAFYDTTDKKWVDYKLTIDKSAGTVTVESLAEGETPPEPPAKKDESSKDDSAVKTRTVDNATGLADGVYKPDSFSFSGGTGKVVIVCDRIEVKGGKVYATIRFTKRDGSPASVDMLRANGRTYSGTNQFTIPVELNKNNKIVARTTAMSQPHWIQYTIFIALAAAGGDASGSALDNTTDFDAEAPAILGLEAVGEVETPYSDLMKIFSYEDGYYLIEVDAVRDTARDTVEARAEMEKEALAETDDAAQEAADSKAEEVALDEEAGIADSEEGSSEDVSMNGLIAGLYRNEIIKYFVIPEGKEAPAGLDKEIIIMQQPCENAYVSSEGALGIISGLGKSDAVGSVGIEDQDVIKDAAFSGTFDDWDLRAMIKDGTDLVVESSGILPADEKTIDADMDRMIRLAERATQMDMAMFIDRSTDETNTLAQAEWYKVYGIIFNCSDIADKLYSNIEGTASEKDKEAALTLLKERADERLEMIEQAKKTAGLDGSKED